MIIPIIFQFASLLLFSCGFFYIRPFNNFSNKNIKIDESSFKNDRIDMVEDRIISIAHKYVSSSGITPRPPFDKVVFVVIDALRYDFVYSNRFETGFNWLRSTIMNKDGDTDKIPVKYFLAMARTPTVTLPRLKALTSGRSPVFLDLINNLDQSDPYKKTQDSSVQDVDSWIHQLHLRWINCGKCNVKNKSKSNTVNESQNCIEFLENRAPNISSNIYTKHGCELSRGPALFIGDETWLRMFPTQLHEESFGVMGMFALDTVFVDLEVEEKLPDALERRDWDALVLHFLGVDHIGHAENSPYSPLMIPKLQQMDKNIQNLFSAVNERDSTDGTRTLIVALGDHGMTESGNHGGDSFDEVATASIFLSNSYVLRNNNENLEKTTELEVDEKIETSMGPVKIIQQVDIATSISLLLGLDVPKNGTGILVSDLIPENVAIEERAILYSRSAIQLVNLTLSRNLNPLASKLLEELDNCSQAHENANLADLPTIINRYKLISNLASEVLTLNDGKFDYKLMIDAILVSLISVFTTFLFFGKFNQSVKIIAFSLAAFSIFSESYILTTIIQSVILYVIFFSTKPKINKEFLTSNILGTLTTLGYVISQIATSYIKEEHLFWYHMLTTCLLLDQLPLILKFVHFLVKEKQIYTSYDLAKVLIFQIVPKCVNTIASVFFVRILRSINQVGFLKTTTINKVMRDSLSPRALSIVQSCTLIVSILLIYVYAKSNLIKSRSFNRSQYALTIYCLMTVIYKILFENIDVIFARIDKILWAQLSLLIGLITFILSMIDKSYSISQSVIAITLILCHKIHNTPVLFLTFLLTKLMFFEPSATSFATASCLFHVSFFSLGSTHTISSIDFSPAYIAQRTFFGPLVSFLIFIMTWGSSIFVFLSMILGSLYKRSPYFPSLKDQRTIDVEEPHPHNLHSCDVDKSTNLKDIMSKVYSGQNLTSDFRVALGLRSFVQLCLLGIIFLHRHHLDVWNVFAPRLIFEFGWTIFYATCSASLWII